MTSFRVSRELPALLSLVSILVVLAFLAPSFFALSNLRDLALATVPVLIVALGMTLVIVLGQIDISVGSIFAITAVVAGLTAQAGWPMSLVCLATVVSGLLLGMVNGALISFVRIPSIVVTLATMVAWRESLRWLTGGAWLQGLPPTFQWFGYSQSAGQFAIVGCALVIFALLAWSCWNISGFRALYATGSDPEAATLAGIDTQLVTFSAFALVGALTGLASLLNTVRFADVPANSGTGLELKAIAAVVVGGTPISGGRATLPGTLIGVCLLGCLGPALTFLGFSAYWEKAAQGAIILLTVLVEGLSSRRRNASLVGAAA